MRHELMYTMQIIFADIIFVKGLFITFLQSQPALVVRWEFSCWLVECLWENIRQIIIKYTYLLIYTVWWCRADCTSQWTISVWMRNTDNLLFFCFSIYQYLGGVKLLLTLALGVLYYKEIIILRWIYWSRLEVISLAAAEKYFVFWACFILHCLILSTWKQGNITCQIMYCYTLNCIDWQINCFLLNQNMPFAPHIV